ncbi:MAG TPA: imidazole glycerol phosphate synthase subunit HisH [Xanthobacteraceae bacterium]|nr:imidazole glycerol phosphate synthase subunit HisH [Xanthobacteraceae bacterium]
MAPQPKVTVVQYGMGNVLSVCRALEHCGAQVELTTDPAAVAAAERLVLPGVGAFGDCMAALAGRRLIDPIREFVATGRPFLGICVGMQILMDASEEFGDHAGLGFIPGRVRQIETHSSTGAARKIPHIGWTSIEPASRKHAWARSPLSAVDPGTPFYFVHSFTAAPSDSTDLLACADYAGAEVVAAVQRDNITGMQFHPEKSGPAGLAVMGAFLS